MKNKNNRITKLTALLLAVLLALAGIAGCAFAEATEEERFHSWNPDVPALKALTEYVEAVTDEASPDDILPTDSIAAFSACAHEEFSLERAGIALHLDRVKMVGTEPDRNILLIHGVTYSSHEFDINYEDYSLVRALAREGYAVWRLDIAGFGQSGEVEDGFLPDSDYAAEDIHAAVDRICEVSGQEKIDVLGWSWGTVTAGRFAGSHPEHLNKLVLYAPILSGIGAYEVTEPFHHNTWEHVVDDFQRTEDGTFDYSITHPVIIELLASSSCHYDGETSPNGGRRDICVDETQSLIDLKRINVPTLVICGDSDPYLNYDRVNAVLDDLPEGSVLEVIEGASHVAYLEKPYHRDFQDRLLRFLNGAEATATGRSSLETIRARRFEGRYGWRLPADVLSRPRNQHLRRLRRSTGGGPGRVTGRGDRVRGDLLADADGGYAGREV